MKNSQSIRSLFALPGFVAGARLSRGEKKQPCARTVGTGAGGAMSKCAGSATCRWQADGGLLSAPAEIVGAATRGKVEKHRDLALEPSSSGAVTV